MKKLSLSLILCLIFIFVIGISVVYGAEYELKLACSQPEGTPEYAMNKFLAKRVSELSAGRIEIETLLGGVMGGERENLEEVKMGTIDLTRTSLGPLTNFNEKLNAVFLPFLFEDYHQVMAIRGSSIENSLVKEVEEAGYKLIVWSAMPPRCVWTKEEPVKSPADLEGQKFRVMESSLLIDSAKAMGGIPTPHPWTELYSALQTGVVDAAENDIVNYYTKHFYEVAPVFSETNHFAGPIVVVANLEKFNSLSEEDQEILLRAGTEAEAYLRSRIDRMYEKSFEDAKNAGATIVRKEDIDIEAFKEATQSVYEKYESSLGEFKTKLEEYTSQ